MCGFGGVYHPVGVKRDRVLSAAQAVSHRGPDYLGMALFDKNFEPVADDGVLGVFHNRLAILDLDERANQPFEDSNHLLLFNGEIYNFKEIAKELTDFGYVLTTSSDTEVLFLALKVWGHAVIKRLNGMFAFAYFEKKSSKLILCRDRVGIKPLYYRIAGSHFCFASELDSILRFSNEELEVSSTSISSYRQLGFTGSPDSIWSGVKILTPGAILSVELANNTTPEVKYYWSASVAFGRDINKFENIQSVRVSLSDALESQLVADVPIGMFVSGGVDSSTLAVLASRSSVSKDITYFTVKFDLPTEHDESVQAREFLLDIGVPDGQIKPVIVNSAELLKSWLSIYSVVDEPFGDYAILLNYAISKAASKHVKVVITGDGGDEVFGGYERYRTWHYENKNYLKSLLFYPLYLAASLVDFRSLTIRLEHNPVIKYLRSISPRHSPVKEWRQIVRSLDVTKEIGRFSDSFEFPRLVDFKLYLPDGMLFKVDRSTMAVGLEARVPFLDNSIVDMSMSLDMLDDQKPLKWRLKETLRDLAPNYDFDKPKSGFSLPLAKWMREDWSNVILELISSDDVSLLGLNKFRLKWDYRKLMRGNDYYAYRLWIDCNLILWYQTKNKIIS